MSVDISITIREITEENRGIVESLDGNSGFLSNPREMLRDMAEGRNPQARAIYLGETVIGFVLWDDYGNGVMLRGIMIDKQYQNQGLGKKAAAQLFNEVAKYWKGPKKCEIWISINKDNTAAKKLAKHIGFTRIETGYKSEKYVFIA